MNIIGLGDFHLRDTTPRARCDDFRETILNKLDWVVDLANERGAILIFAGDTIDRIGTSYHLIRRVGKILRKLNSPAFYVLGQHDLLYHSIKHLDDTPISILDDMGLIIRLTSTPHAIIKGKTLENRIMLYGASWQEEIVDPDHDYAITVMVAHRMVVKSKELFPGQEDHSKASALLRKHPNYNLIITGDNHASFSAKVGGGKWSDELDDRWLINSGSIGRMKKDQVGHQPTVFLYDTKKRNVEPIHIPVAPVEDVFIKHILEEEGTDRKDALTKHFAEFVENLKHRSEDDEADIITELLNMAKAASLKEPIFNKIQGIIGEIHD